MLVTPNRLTFARPDEIIDPYHYVEYDPAQLAALSRRHFGTVRDGRHLRLRALPRDRGARAREARRAASPRPAAAAPPRAAPAAAAALRPPPEPRARRRGSRPRRRSASTTSPSARLRPGDEPRPGRGLPRPARADPAPGPDRSTLAARCPDASTWPATTTTPPAGPRRWPTSPRSCCRASTRSEARSVAEVGAYAGDLTRLLADWAAAVRRASCWRSTRPRSAGWSSWTPTARRLELVRQTSLDALPEVELPDVVVIDGDHNYWTVTRGAAPDRRARAGRRPAAAAVPRRVLAARAPRRLLRPRADPGGRTATRSWARRRASSPASPGRRAGTAVPTPSPPRTRAGRATACSPPSRTSWPATTRSGSWSSCRRSSASAWSSPASRPGPAALAGILDPWDRHPLLERPRGQPRAPPGEGAHAARPRSPELRERLARQEAVLRRLLRLERVRGRRAPVAAAGPAGVAHRASRWSRRTRSAARWRLRLPRRRDQVCGAGWPARSGPVTCQDRLPVVSSSALLELTRRASERRALV